MGIAFGRGHLIKDYCFIAVWQVQYSWQNNRTAATSSSSHDGDNASISCGSFARLNGMHDTGEAQYNAN
jgi:hypothetical protein